MSDYLEVIKEPMDLSAIMTKIDTHKYTAAKDFLVDVDLICSNALEYNPDKDPGGKETIQNTQINGVGRAVHTDKSFFFFLLKVVLRMRSFTAILFYIDLCFVVNYSFN